MERAIDLSRFVTAHEQSCRTALGEIRNGRKVSHWMWYIFPQLRGLGNSQISRYYAVRGLDEAAAFLKDPYLGKNLREISGALLELETDDPEAVFGFTDSVKLRSSMTLFSLAPGADPVFGSVLEKYFGGEGDDRTRALLGLS